MNKFLQMQQKIYLWIINKVRLIEIIFTVSNSHNINIIETFKFVLAFYYSIQSSNTIFHFILNVEPNFCFFIKAVHNYSYWHRA